MKLADAVLLVLDDYRRHDLQCTATDADVIESIPAIVDMDEIRVDQLAGAITDDTAEAYATVFDAHPDDLASALSVAA